MQKHHQKEDLSLQSQRHHWTFLGLVQALLYLLMDRLAPQGHLQPLRPDRQQVIVVR